MAKAEYIQEGENITVTCESAKEYHEPMLVGDRLAVVLEKAGAGEKATAAVTGVWRLPADGGKAVAAGEKVFWDATNECITATSTGNKAAGFAVEAISSGDTTAKFKING